MVAGVGPLLVLTAGPSSGSASGGEGPGGTVTVGASAGASSGGSPGNPAGPGGSSGANSGSGGSPWSCTYMPLGLNDQALPPGGPTPGGWYSMTCNETDTGASFNRTLWISAQTPSPSLPTVDPRALALQAERSLQLPRPAVHFNPPGSSVVNLPTWLWIDGSIWHPYSVTATAGSVTATAVATPTFVTWTMGDGSVVNCDGPGMPFDVSRPAAQQTSSCDYVYRITSADQRTPDDNPDDAAFGVLASVSWAVEWSAQGAPGGGALPTLTTSTLTGLRVEQVESIFGAALGPTFTGTAEQ